MPRALRAGAGVFAGHQTSVFDVEREKRGQGRQGEVRVPVGNGTSRAPGLGVDSSLAACDGMVGQPAEPR